MDRRGATVPVELQVELPFWLMVPDCAQNVEVNGHTFLVDIRDDYVEWYVGVIGDSKSTCLYAGPRKRLRPDLQNAIDKSKAPTMMRKCKTVLLIHSECDKNVVVGSRQNDQRKISALLYLKSFCEAHLDIVNRLIQQYRLSTYDYFAYEVCPWDVPIWFVKSGADAVRITLQDYATWDEKPMLFDKGSSEKGERYKLIDPSALQTAFTIQPSAGEFDLLDALNFMQRGDYSGAVRRITTAIEAQLESALRRELSEKCPSADIEKTLKASEMNFRDRLDQYQVLSGRELSDTLEKELMMTRTLRHSIVHRGKRITFGERGLAQKSVDTGRWIFNWFENQPARRDVREKRIGMRLLGLHF